MRKASGPAIPDALLVLLQAVFLSSFLPDDLDADDLQLDLEESKLHPTIQCTPSPGEQPGKPFSLNTAGLLQAALNPQSPTTLLEVFHSHEDHKPEMLGSGQAGDK